MIFFHLKTKYLFILLPICVFDVTMRFLKLSMFVSYYFYECSVPTYYLYTLFYGTVGCYACFTSFIFALQLFQYTNHLVSLIE